MSRLAARAWIWGHGLGLGECGYLSLTETVWHCRCGSTWGARPASEHAAGALFALRCLMSALFRPLLKEK